MRKRLIELLEKIYPKTRYIPAEECREKIADAILEDGWFRPPCKVGDVVYYIYFNKVYEGMCHAITMHNNLQIHLYDYDGDSASYPASKVFLTREEAEQALKGGDE